MLNWGEKLIVFAGNDNVTRMSDMYCFDTGTCTEVDHGSCKSYFFAFLAHCPALSAGGFEGTN